MTSRVVAEKRLTSCRSMNDTKAIVLLSNEQDRSRDLANRAASGRDSRRSDRHEGGLQTPALPSGGSFLLLLI